MTKESVTINGIAYDAATGLPLSDAKKSASKKASVSESKPAPRGRAIAKKPQKSVTLNRRAVRKSAKKVSAGRPVAKAVHRSVRTVTPRGVAVKPSPVKPKKIATVQVKKPSVKVPAAVKHPLVSHFTDIRPGTKPRLDFSSAAPVAAPAPEKPTPTPAAPTPQPAAPVVAVTSQPAAPAPTPEPATETDALIQDALKNLDGEPIAPDTSQKGRQPLLKKTQRLRKRLVATAVILFFVLIAGIVATVNIVHIEMAIATSSSGVPARLPGYNAPGYQLKSPITYSDNQVKIEYENARQSASYSITATRAETASSELTNSDRTGVIIRNHVRYTINYTSLTAEQVRRITETL